jgi:hypothetical protein
MNFAEINFGKDWDRCDVQWLSRMRHIPVPTTLGLTLRPPVVL